MFLSKIGLITRLTPPAHLAPTTRLKHTLPDLPYDYNALEPYVSAQIMELHHSKHHQTYVNNLNMVEEKIAEAEAKKDLTGVIGLQSALKFHGGGHLNHTIFWQNLSPKGGELGGELLQAIDRDFGSVENFKTMMANTTVGIQGSGWGWLGYDKTMKRLQIATCANQDPLESTTGLVPLFGIDVWEHAYYLQYKGMRPDYIKGLWNIVNWKDVAAKFTKAKA